MKKKIVESCKKNSFSTGITFSHFVPIKSHLVSVLAAAAQHCIICIIYYAEACSPTVRSVDSLYNLIVSQTKVERSVRNFFQRWRFFIVPANSCLQD